jgi:hypothetical protein
VDNIPVSSSEASMMEAPAPSGRSWNLYHVHRLLKVFRSNTKHRFAIPDLMKALA